MHLIFNILLNQSRFRLYVSQAAPGNTPQVHSPGGSITLSVIPNQLPWSNSGLKKSTTVGPNRHWRTASVCIGWVPYNFTFSVNSSHHRWRQRQLNTILCCRDFIAWHNRENSRNPCMKIPLVCMSSAFGGISTSAVSGTFHITLTDSCAGKKTPNSAPNGINYLWSDLDVFIWLLLQQEKKQRNKTKTNIDSFFRPEVEGCLQFLWKYFTWIQMNMAI